MTQGRARRRLEALERNRTCEAARRGPAPIVFEYIDDWRDDPPEPATVPPCEECGAVREPVIISFRYVDDWRDV